jgi:hypothetical protein
MDVVYKGGESIKLKLTLAPKEMLAGQDMPLM